MIVREMSPPVAPIVIKITHKMQNYFFFIFSYSISSNLTNFFFIKKLLLLEINEKLKKLPLEKALDRYANFRLKLGSYFYS